MGFHPFGSLAEGLDGPRSASFGVPPDGRPQRPESYYQTDTPYLCFDISNNQILCTITSAGLMENACILEGLVPAGLSNRYLPGIYVEKDLIGGGPWALAIRRKAAEPVSLHELPRVEAELLGNLFPLFTYQHDDLRMRLLAFAPTTAAPTSVPPRAVVVVLHLQNQGNRPFEGAVLGPDGVSDLSQVSSDPGAPACREAVACLDGTTWDPDSREISVALESGQAAAF